MSNIENEDRATKNVEFAKRGFQVLNDEGVEAFLEFVHPDFEVTTPPTLAAEPDTYRGHDGIRRYFDSFYEAMDKVRFEPDDFSPVGDRVVVPLRLVARGRTTGIEAEQKAVQVWELRDGLAYRLRLFTDLEDAMESVHGSGDA